MDKIYIGNITGCHGIKGELKVLSDFEKSDIVFKNNFKIFIANNEFKITSHRIHKNFHLITINNILDINEVFKYVKNDVYINRSDLNLNEDEYLLHDLIGFNVFDNDKNIGVVVDIMHNKVHNFICCKLEDKKYFIPLIDVYIKNVDVSNKKIITINGEDLII